MDVGIVVFDDWRSPDFPGVAAAVWEEIIQGSLTPLCLTSQKLYGTWHDDPHDLREAIRAEIGRMPYINAQEHLLRTQTVLRVEGNRQAQDELLRGKTLTQKVTLARPSGGGGHTATCTEGTSVKRLNETPRLVWQTLVLGGICFP
jgi:hypothetical protein